jgi:hypothetical protein
MKNSHMIAYFAAAFLGSVLWTNVSFHKSVVLGNNGNSNNVDLVRHSIASSKKSFSVSNTKNKKAPNQTPGSDKAADKADVANVSPGANETVQQIELILPQEEIDWIRRRNKTYWDVYLGRGERDKRNKRWNMAIHDPNRHDINETTGFRNYNEDTEGPWMDFLITGHPKTGTTTLVANLAKVAPMKVKDFCTPTPAGLLHYLFDAWPRKYPEIMDGPNQYVSDSSLHMVGSKCPQFIGNPELVSRYTQAHPRMKLIVGIRHPVEWIGSFLRMASAQRNLYKYMKMCPHYESIDPLSGIPGVVSSERSRSMEVHERCINECRCGSPICFHRSRLHLGLARIGKTALSSMERELLAPGDPDGGENLFDAHAQNPIFVYDQSQMKDDSYWDELASFLGLSYIPNVHYHSSHGGHSNFTVCTPFLDEFRSKMMEHSYNMSVWLEDYLLPLGEDPTRTDVVIANTTSFREIIQTYKDDPCERLVRNYKDGTYVLDPHLGGVIIGATTALEPPTNNFEIHSSEFKACKAIYPENNKKAQEIKDNDADGKNDQKKEKRRRREKARKEKLGDVDKHQRMVDEAIAKAAEAKHRFEAGETARQ